jgi:hypothetical protein
MLQPIMKTLDGGIVCGIGADVLGGAPIEEGRVETSPRMASP